MKHSAPTPELRAHWSRRRFISALATSATGSATFGARAATRRTSSQRTGRIALLATEVRKYSHAQHFIDRFVEGYGWQGRHHRPALQLASLYVDQKPNGDLSEDRARRHGVKIFPTIAEALTLGGSTLDVDGVLIIAEHGRYPRNEKGQTLYPRYKFFREITDVFERSGRSVPVFNDKHLSTDWDECSTMVRLARELDFPFLAGSSLPVTWRIPDLEFERGTPLQESVCVAYGGLDSYDIHALETAQCMSERRRGGETGVSRIEALRGEDVWKRVGARESTERLVMAALTRSHTFKGAPGFTCGVPTLAWLGEHCRTPIGYFIEHRDGFRTSIYLLSELLQDFNYAGLRGDNQIQSCQMYLPMPPARTTLANFFNPLVNNIEQTIEQNRAPYPVERTWLASGMVISALDSLQSKKPVDTPHLSVTYQPSAKSSHWRA